jgi:hypothetical protein
LSGYGPNRPTQHISQALSNISVAILFALLAVIPFTGREVHLNSNHGFQLVHWAAWVLLGLFVVLMNRYTGWDVKGSISNTMANSMYTDPRKSTLPSPGG